jgi:hypothetical protein
MVQTTGRVLTVRRLWWIKINTRPLRRHALEGAAFPHAVRIAYRTEGTVYRRWKYVGWRSVCPAPGETIPVWYDMARPRRCRIAPPPRLG